MLNGPLSPWPAFSQEEADAVQQVLLSNQVNYWTGEEGRKFEKEFAHFCGTEYAIAVSNGSVALELALIGVGIDAGDEVIVTPRSFIASASSIVNVGAKPVFVDVDRDSQNITPDSIESALTDRTRGIICVHLAGWPCDMDPINAIASKHGISVIEDCAQAHGARYKGRPVGGLGDVGCWSFCQDKIMTTGGEGGMVTTNNADYWNAMWSYKDHGKSYDTVYNRNHPPGFRWLHESFGTNWRLPEMQSAIGRIQLRMMPEWHRKRRENCNLIWEAARECPALRAPEIPERFEHGGYKAYVFVNPEQLKPGWNRDRIQTAISDKGIPCFSGSCAEIYLEKNFQQAGLAPSIRLPIAKELGETSLMFLVHPTLTEREIGQTVEAIKETMLEAAESN